MNVLYDYGKIVQKELFFFKFLCDLEVSAVGKEILQ
jgi:hypothetical protein